MRECEDLRREVARLDSENRALRLRENRALADLEEQELASEDRGCLLADYSRQVEHLGQELAARAAELEDRDREIEERRREVEAAQAEVCALRSSRVIRFAKSYDRLRRRMQEMLTASARRMWWVLPRGLRARMERRLREGDLPSPLMSLAALADRSLRIDGAQSPFDKIDVIFRGEPTVSIVIPCFNQGSFLNAALDSLVAQTYPFLQVVIVDDGSTDADTVELLASLHRPSLDLRVIRQENMGPAAARNTGVEHASGPFILPLDADDTLEPSCVLRMVALLKSRPDIGVAYCDIRFFGEKEEVSECPEYDLNSLLDENFMVVTSMFRKELWQAAGGYNGELKYGYEDWCLWLDFAAMGYYGKRIPAPLFNYRIKQESRNTTAVTNNMVLIGQIRERHKELYANREMRRLWRDRIEWSDPKPVAAPPTSDCPLVTIIIPCYNYGRYVGDAVR